MKLFGKASLVVGVLLTAGCNVTVNNASLENQVDAAASDLENAAEGAARSVDRAANVIENQADAIENGVDVKVNLRTRGSGTDANAQ
jgi:hypothetical protein